MLRVAPRLPLVVKFVAQQVEHQLAKPRVTGSIPVVLKIKMKAKVCDTEQIKCTYHSCNMEASGTRKESDERVKVVICVNRRHPVSPQERGGELNVMILSARLNQ